MKTLYLDCGMGAAGDMMMAALLELLPDSVSFLTQLNSVGIPGVEVTALPSVKCGIQGTHISVTVRGTEEHSHDHPHSGHDHMHDHDHGHSHSHAHDHAHDHEHGHIHDHEHEHDGHDHPHTPAHTHHGLADIQSLLRNLPVSDRVKQDALAVYRLIAGAESHVHGVPVDQIHFHEVGSLDAVADIVGVCLLMERLAPDEVVASPVHVGSGQVRCAHGILPVPAPATAYLLQGIPSYGGQIRGELCTPTGAALLKHFVHRFGPQPLMAVSGVGYGMGNKDFEAANCLRASLGESEGTHDQVVEMRCNLDDMTAEEAGYAIQILLNAGALDVFTLPIGMKKSRPGVLLSCLCKVEDQDKLVRLMFAHTSTLGVRMYRCDRAVLQRIEEEVVTPYGKVRVKTASGYGVTRHKAEYEDIAIIAASQNLPIKTVRDAVERALEE